MGKKVLELNGNAVIGFKQYFDLESEKKAITARAIGCAVNIAPIYYSSSHSEFWKNISNANTGASPLSPGLGSLTNQPQKYAKSPQMEAGVRDSPTSSFKELPMLGFKSNDPVLLTLHSFTPGTILATGGFTHSL